MARYSHARNSFLLGEVSPSLYGRTDIDQYHQMCEKLKNMVVRPHGGATGRPGTIALTGSLADTDFWSNTDFNAKDADKIKIIPFKYTPVASTFAQFAGFIILTLTKISFYNIVVPGSSGDISATSGGGTYGSDWILYTLGPGGVNYNDVNSIQWAQYGNLLVITKQGSPPLVVYYNGTNLAYFVWGTLEVLSNGTLDANEQQRLLPYDAENSTAVTMTVSNASVGTGRTLTASAATFATEMIGRYIRVRSGSTVGVALITAYTSTTVVTVQVLRAFAGTAAYADWSFAQWGGDRGWPQATCFFEDRLYFGGTPAFPDRIWGSQVGDLYEFAATDPTATPALSGSFQANIGQSDSDFICFLFPREKLFAATRSKEAYLDSIDETFAIGFGNTRVVSNSYNGGHLSQPLGIGDGLLYIDQSKFRILELIFLQRDKNFTVSNMSYYSPDIVRDRAREDLGAFFSDDYIPYYRQGLKGIAFTQVPFPILWGFDHTGRLYSMTRDRDNNVLAWAHHSLGGILNTDDEPKVLDLCSFRLLNQDYLILVVQRKVSGVTRTCFEMMYVTFQGRELYDSSYIESGSAAFNGNGETAQEIMGQALPIQMDYTMVKASHTASTSITGLAAYASQEVSVVADGIYIGELTVSAGGVLTLTTAAKAVMLGFKYTKELIPTALDTNALFGTGLGSIKRTDEVIVELERTVNLEIGVAGDEDSLKSINFREASVISTDPTPLFTGEKIQKVMASYQQKQNVWIRQEDPYPLTVNAIVVKGILYD